MNYDDDGGGEDQDVQVPTSIQSSWAPSDPSWYTVTSRSEGLLNCNHHDANDGDKEDLAEAVVVAILQLLTGEVIKLALLQHSVVADGKGGGGGASKYEN